MIGKEQSRLLLLVLTLAIFVAGCAVAGGQEDGRATAPGEQAASREPAPEEVTEQDSSDKTNSKAAGVTKAKAGQAETKTDGARAKAGDAGAKSASAGRAAPSGPSFVADPKASGGSGARATRILDVRYGEHEGYERVVVDLGTKGGPAEAVPEWKLASPTGDGLLRVFFPSVESTEVTDGGFGGGLLGDYYVARAPKGGMFVDVFATKAFSYRVMELSDPARLVVDFATSGKPLAIPLPAEGKRTVLVEPRRDAEVGDSFEVSGYSRNFEAMNTVILEDASGRVLARKTVRSNDWSDTWGYFETTIEAPSFSGEGTIKVGALSARDGSFEGIEVPVSGG
jgi:hypothetical protein